MSRLTSPPFIAEGNKGTRTLSPKLNVFLTQDVSALEITRSVAMVYQVLPTSFMMRPRDLAGFT